MELNEKQFPRWLLNKWKVQNYFQKSTVVLANESPDQKINKKKHTLLLEKLAVSVVN